MNLVVNLATAKGTPVTRVHRRLLMVLFLVLAACGGEASGDEGELSVVATTSVLADVARNVVGDAGEVTTVIPPGADPHEFEPSPQQIEAMNTADLLIVNGLNLEEGLSDTIEGAEAAGARVLVLADHVDPIPFAESDEHAGEDPHFWQDPVRMAEAVRAVGAQLDDIGELTSRADAYAAELEALDGEIEELLAVIPSSDRKLVTNHEAFGYFADRYGLEVVGAVIPGGTTLAEPSAAGLEELAETIADEDVRAIFAENTQPDRLAQALAAEGDLEVEVVELYSDSLGEDGSGAETYAGMLRTNAERVADALS